MENKPEFDLQSAHKYFSSACFNQAWDLIDKPDRTLEEDEAMIRLCLSSTWHWTQRQDCTDKNLSVSFWQAARIYAILGQADNARRYGQMSLEAGKRGLLTPFYMGYAYEALARAEMVAGNHKAMNEYLAKAIKYTEAVIDPEEKKLLLDDLEKISPS